MRLTAITIKQVSMHTPIYEIDTESREREQTCGCQGGRALGEGRTGIGD